MNPALRWPGALALALLACLICARPYLATVTPLNEWAVHGYAGALRLEVLGLAWIADPGLGDRRLRLAVAVPAPAEAGDRPIYVVSELTEGGALQVPVTLLWVLLAWPAAGWRERLLAMALAIPALGVLEMACNGMPLLGAAASVSLLIESGRETMSLLERWGQLMESGGRLALTLACGLAVMTVARCAAMDLGASGGVSGRTARAPCASH